MVFRFSEGKTLAFTENKVAPDHIFMFKRKVIF